MVLWPHVSRRCGEARLWPSLWAIPRGTVAPSVRGAASAPPTNSQMPIEQSTASVEKLVGKPASTAAGARVFGASHWIARVLSSEPTPVPMMTLPPAIAEATSRRAIVVR